MSENTEIKTLVVAVMPNHPSGQRNRAGFTFTTQPTVYEVTAEQEKMIREDKFLRIIERGTALDDAMSAYKKKSNWSSDESNAGSTEPSEPLKNEDSDAGNKNPTEDKGSDETTSPDANSEGNPEDPKDPEVKDPADIPPADENKQPEAASAKPISRMSKDELIAGLEAKGLKAGEGFNPEATNKDLAALLSSL